MSYAVDIQGLEKTYASGLQALKGINLTVEPGDFFALLGPNGAGKSTTIGILCSLVSKTAGTVRVFDYDIDTHFTEAKRCIGIVPQEFNFNQFEKVLDIVVTQGGYYGLTEKLARQRAEKYLRLLDLWDMRTMLSRNLSGGMKRRLMIARALVHEPQLLILDEPTAGVDIELRRSMWDFLRDVNRQGTTIILTTHYLEEAESLCRNIAIINQGAIVENTGMRQLLQQLHREVFIVDTTTELPADLTLPEFTTQRIDANSFEVTVDKSQSINALFALLDRAGIVVCSLRNKANRLEEMFVSLLDDSRALENGSDDVTNVAGTAGAMVEERS